MSDYYTPPPPPPPPHGSGGPPPPPPPPPGGGGYQGGPYQQGGHYQGGPHRGPEYPGGHYPPGGMPPGAPPKKRGMLPWILGCGGCGLLIVLALLFFGVIGYFAESAERSRSVTGDSTVVVDTSVVGTDSFVVESDGSFEGQGTPADEPPAEGATDDANTPTDDAPPADGTGEGEGEIKEIKPLRP
ncbi:MAG TPA: hypothetical protein VGB15_11140 [Longimicrobium sp.]